MNNPFDNVAPAARRECDPEERVYVSLKTRLTHPPFTDYLSLAVLTAIATPIWLFGARFWWSAVHALLTKPWNEILCVGTACVA